MAVWDDVLAGRDRQVFEAHRTPKPLGHRPAVIVVDVNYAFVGTRRENILDSMSEYRTSCGEEGWRRIDDIKALLDTARGQGIPVFYSTMMTVAWKSGPWATRSRAPGQLELVSPEELERRRVGSAIVKEIEPQPQDIVLAKRAASVFPDTPLLSILQEMDIDTLLVAGTTTSGCVRATVVDGANLRFHIGVVEDCCFDRFEISHKVSLMDMHAKYGNVITLAEAKEYLGRQQAILRPQALATT